MNPDAADDTLELLMRLLDDASDFVRQGGDSKIAAQHQALYDASLSDEVTREDEFRARLLAYQAAQASALGAIALLLARRDEEVWRGWLAW